VSRRKTELTGQGTHPSGIGKPLFSGTGIGVSGVEHHSFQNPVSDVLSSHSDRGGKDFVGRKRRGRGGKIFRYK
jgi:hypothetical protein